MQPYLDLFWTVIVLLETGTSGGEVAGERRSVVGGRGVKMPGKEVAWGRRLLSWLEAVQFGGEAAAKCWAMGRLELTVPDGEAASAKGEGPGEVWHSVTGGMVAKMPNREAVGKRRVMWGLEVGVPGREAVSKHWESVRELSTWLIRLQ